MIPADLAGKIAADLTFLAELEDERGYRVEARRIRDRVKRLLAMIEEEE